MTTGNANAYLRQTARERLHRYKQARERLSGWSQNELRAVLDVLNGAMLDPTLDVGEQIAASMEDAEKVNSTATAWGIDQSRWNELVSNVHQREPIARAVRIIADEYWGEASEHAADLSHLFI